MCPKDAGGMTFNSVDPDQTAPLRPVCPKTYDHYGIGIGKIE